MMPQAPAQPKPTAPAAAPTLGHQLHHSPAVRAAASQIVSELHAKSAQLTDARPARADLKQSYDDLMARAAAVRGRNLLYPYIGSGLGNGALVELADGSVKWDMICGIGVHFFGHSDPEMTQLAIDSALDDTLKHGNLSSNFEPYTFMETLLGEAGKGSRLKHCYLATSGAMANENALKLCYQKRSPAPRVIAFRDCFTGRSTTMAQIGDTADYRQGLPLSVLVDYMPFFDEYQAKQVGLAKYIDGAVAKLAEYLDRYPGQHACFIFELIQGEGGFNVGNRDFFKALMELCRERRVAIWDDEIQTFGRTPRMFAYELFELGEYIDVLTVGKMTQTCATLWTADFNPKGGLLSGTFTGEGVSFRIGQRAIERLRDGNYYGDDGSIAKHHALFRQQIQALISKHPSWFPAVPGQSELVGGSGGMMKFTPFGGAKDKVNALCKACFEEGVILFYCGHGPYHVRMLPPLGVMQAEQWPKVFACIERALAKVGA
jgi:4-aminobutyrate aminotransferase-like enzyme